VVRRAPAGTAGGATRVEFVSAGPTKSTRVPSPHDLAAPLTLTLTLTLTLSAHSPYVATLR